MLQPGSAELTAPRTIKVNEQEVEVSFLRSLPSLSLSTFTQVIYELSSVEDHIEPRLRLRIESHDQHEDTILTLPAHSLTRDESFQLNDGSVSVLSKDDVRGDGGSDADVSVLVSPGVVQVIDSAHPQ